MNYSLAQLNAAQNDLLLGNPFDFKRNIFLLEAGPAIRLTIDLLRAARALDRLREDQQDDRNTASSRQSRFFAFQIVFFSFVAPSPHSFFTVFYWVLLLTQLISFTDAIQLCDAALLSKYFSAAIDRKSSQNFRQVGNKK